jgi:spermidine/putrescine transport system substrate-binding protein
MKKLLTLALGAALAAAVIVPGAGCKRPTPVLHVYTWADYVKPELVARFEAEQKCKIVIDTFDSNESMYAKIKAGATGYDIITPSSYMASLMQKQGMLQELKKDLLPNTANVDPEYLTIAVDRDMKYSVPYMLTTTGIGYLKSKATNFEDTWAVFDRKDLKGRMTMLNDMRETVGAALKSLGYSLNTRDEKQLAEARDVVIRWKKNLAKFENEAYKAGLANGEFIVTHGYSGDIFQAAAENADIAFVVPREGTSISADDLVVTKEAKEVELAHRFINFLHDPKVAAENSDFISYLCPNKAAYPLLSEEMRNNPAVFLTPELKAKCEVIADLEGDNAKYTKVWDAIKAAE